MYHPLLYIHSYFRWGILMLLVYLVFQAFQLQKKPQPQMQQFGKGLTWYVILLDIQALIGFLMYLFFSPAVNHALQNFGDAMRHTDLRFWAVEHPILMVIILILGHIAKIKFKRSSSPENSLKGIGILLGISLVILLLVIPWPFSWVSRPFFRF